MKKLGGQKRGKGPSECQRRKGQGKKEKEKKEKKNFGRNFTENNKFFFSYIREASREKRYEYDLSSDDDDRNCVAGEY